MIRTLLFCAVALSACSTPKQHGPRPEGGATLDVTIEGFENDTGQALVAVFLDAEGWPGEAKKSFAARELPIRERKVEVRFEDVPAGRVAVSVFHDENGNMKLDTGLFGIPSEAYGFSRDARGIFGPASFEDSAIELADEEQRSIKIRVE